MPIQQSDASTTPGLEKQPPSVTRFGALLLLLVLFFERDLRLFAAVATVLFVWEAVRIMRFAWLTNTQKTIRIIATGVVLGAFVIHRLMPQSTFATYGFYASLLFALLVEIVQYFSRPQAVQESG